MFLSFFRVGVLSLVLVGPLLGYGNAGHEAVGNEAAFYLKGSRAEAEVKLLLTKDEDLGRAATWADRAKIPGKYLTEEMQNFVANNPEHHSYHYCDIPFQEKAYRLGVVGTSAKDIVQTMETCIKVLQNPEDKSDNPLKINKRIALMLIAHYVGDMHQPLHIGCSYIDKDNHFIDPETGAVGQADAGANDLHLNTRTTLHGYWDTATVKAARDHAGSTDFIAYLTTHYPPQPDWKGTGPIADWPIEWATDTLHLGASVFEGIKIAGRHTVAADEKHPEHDEWVVTLSPGYDVKSRDIVEIELAKAGYRLAELLKAIWPGDAPATPVPSPTPKTGLPSKMATPAPQTALPIKMATPAPKPFSHLSTPPPMTPPPPMGPAGL